jgi:osmoprotectant transport system ATP-binding protein
MADRIAIFRAGRLEQYAVPDELLARPANDFVAGFVGTDRTLKRLRRIHVNEVMTHDVSALARNRGSNCPTVKSTDDLRRVATLFLEHGVDALACTDGDGSVVGCITREAVAARLDAATSQVGGGESAP